MSARSTPLKCRETATEFNIKIAKLIRKYRKEANITQLELGIMVDCPEKRIRAIEQGGGGSFEIIWSIIQYLNIPLENIPSKNIE